MSCRHVNSGGFRCPRPSLSAHRGYCRQHAPLPHLPPPVPRHPQPSRRGGRGAGVSRPSTSTLTASHATSESRRRSSSVGRMPTVEQLLARVDRLRAASPSAESAWSEDSDHETPTLGSSRQHAASGYAADSSGAESDPEGLDPVDYLHHAGVYTVEEAALLARDKLVRQQALYIQQFSRLQHLLREGRRRYLHEVKLERQAEADALRERQLAAEAGEDYLEQSSQSERSSFTDAGPSRRGSKGTPQLGRYEAEEKLRAVWRYHRHRGVCAVLRRKAWERRANTTAHPGPRCILTEGGVRCSERCLPGSKYCRKHILNDPHQMLFVPCVGRRNLTLEQRDEEFTRNRRKGARVATRNRTTAATGSRQPTVGARSGGRSGGRVVRTAVKTSSTTPLVPTRATGLPKRLAALKSKDIVRAIAPRPKGAARTGTVKPKDASRAAAFKSKDAATRSVEGAAARTVTCKSKDASGKTVALKSKETARVVALKSKNAAAVSASHKSKDRAVLSATLSSKDGAHSSKDAAAAANALKSKDVAATTAAAGALKSRDTVPTAAHKSKDATAARGVLKSKDMTTLIDADKTKDTINVAASAKSKDSAVMSEDSVTSAATTTSEDVAALVAALSSKDAAALAAALRSRDKAALAAALKSKDVAPLVAALKSKDAATVLAFLKSKGTAALTATRESNDQTSVAAALNSKDPATVAAAVNSKNAAAVAAALKSKNAAVLSAALKSRNAAAVIAALRSGNGAAIAAALKSRNATAIAAALRPKNTATVATAVKSRNAAVVAAALKSRNVAAMMAALKSKDLAVRALAIKRKNAVRKVTAKSKDVAARVVAAKLTAAAVALAAKKARKKLECQEPVLCVFESDMRCPWHTVYTPDEHDTIKCEADKMSSSKEISIEVKKEVKTIKEEVDDEQEATGFSPLKKKIKMDIDEPTLVGAVEGDVDMKMEMNEESPDAGGDDMASFSGSGNQADRSTESTLSATSPRADEDMDDDGVDMDVDVDPGEVVLQPPPSADGADDADLVAAAQGVAMVGAQEEVAVIQQDDDSLTNAPTAVNEVEVS